MLRRLLNRYREARRAHPRLMYCARGVVFYGVFLLWEWGLFGIDSWTDYLTLLLPVVIITSLGYRFRRDRGDQ